MQHGPKGVKCRQLNTTVSLNPYQSKVRNVGGRLSRIVDGVIYETQEEHEHRIAEENFQFRWRKKRSRNRARADRVRIDISIRADSKCEVCGFCFEPILHVHHIVPVSRGGSAQKSNLVLLCPNCHGLAHHYSHSRKWNSQKYEDWKRGLAGAGLNSEQAERLLLVASREARVRLDGRILAHTPPEPPGSIIVDDAGTPLEPPRRSDPEAMEAALRRIEERFGNLSVGAMSNDK